MLPRASEGSWKETRSSTKGKTSRAAQFTPFNSNSALNSNSGSPDTTLEALGSDLEGGIPFTEPIPAHRDGLRAYWIKLQENRRLKSLKRAALETDSADGPSGGASLIQRTRIGERGRSQPIKLMRVRWEQLELKEAYRDSFSAEVDADYTF